MMGHFNLNPSNQRHNAMVGISVEPLVVIEGLTPAAQVSLYKKSIIQILYHPISNIIQILHHISNIIQILYYKVFIFAD